MNRPLVLGGVLGCVLLIAGGAWAMWPEPEPEALEDKDTGLTRNETEDLMRTIGYIQ